MGEKNFFMGVTLKVIREVGAIPSLVALLESGAERAKESAAAGLCEIANDDHSRNLIARSGAIPALVKLLQKGSDRAKELALTALSNISFTEDNEDNLVSIGKAGAIPPLVALLALRSDAMKEKAAFALWELSQIRLTSS